jgi:hypothetical protein
LFIKMNNPGESPEVSTNLMRWSAAIAPRATACMVIRKLTESVKGTVAFINPLNLTQNKIPRSYPKQFYTDPDYVRFRRPALLSNIDRPPKTNTSQTTGTFGTEANAWCFAPKKLRRDADRTESQGYLNNQTIQTHLKSILVHPSYLDCK